MEECKNIRDLIKITDTPVSAKLDHRADTCSTASRPTVVGRTFERSTGLTAHLRESSRTVDNTLRKHIGGDQDDTVEIKESAQRDGPVVKIAFRNA